MPMKKSPINEQTIVAVLELYFPEPAISKIDFLTLGNQNVNVRVVLEDEDVVVRFWGERHAYMGKRLASDIEYELGFLKFYHEQGFPVPKIHSTLAGKFFETIEIDGVERFCAVLDFINGDLEQDYTPQMVKEVARAMAEKHKVAHKFIEPNTRRYPGTIMQMTMQRIDDITELAKEHGVKDITDELNFFFDLAQEFKEKHAAADLDSLPGGIIHGDIMFQNVRFKDEKLVGIFDYDNCRWSHFLEDIVKSIFDEQFRIDEEIVMTAERNQDHIGLFLREYETVRLFTEKEKEYLPLFFQSRFIYQIARNFQKYITRSDDIGDTIPVLVKRYNENKTFFTEPFYQ